MRKNMKENFLILAIMFLTFFVFIGIIVTLGFFGQTDLGSQTFEFIMSKIKYISYIIIFGLILYYINKADDK